jgi:hypothetical protein
MYGAVLHLKTHSYFRQLIHTGTKMLRNIYFCLCFPLSWFAKYLEGKTDVAAAR